MATSRRATPRESRRAAHRRNLQPLFHYPGAQLAALLLLLILGMALAAPLLSRQAPNLTQPSHQLLPPGPGHPLGTDLFGRDVWSRLVWGGRYSLTAALAAIVLSVIPGTLLGLTAGYLGGGADRVMMRIVDVLLAVPSLLLALALVAALGPGLVSAALAVGLAGIPRFARVTRASAQSVRSAGFIEAARAAGARDGRIVLRHVLPNTASTVLVLGALELGYALLNIGALSFLGLGAQAPLPEWGLTLAEGRALLRPAPWVAIAPGMAITLSVLSLNLLADAFQNRFVLRR